MALLNSKQLRYPLSGSFTGSFSGSFVGDGTGITNIASSSYALTASYALNANEINFNTGSFVNTSSFNNYTSSINSTTGSYATTSSINTLTSSFNSFTSSINAFSSSIFSYTQSLNAKTASFATTSSINTLSSSFNSYTQSLNAFSASIFSYTQSLSAKTASFATTSSLNTLSSSFNSYTGSLNSFSASMLSYTSSLNARTASFATTSSLNALSSSYNSFTSSIFSYTQSLNAKTSSFATTGSNQFNGDQTITGSLVVSGSITAQTLIVQTITSSILYSSGSNKFGNDLNNTQQFTGSVTITGSLSVNGSDVLLSNQTSSMSVLSASYALDADLLDGKDSTEFAITGSNTFIGVQNIIGDLTITGSNPANSHIRFSGGSKIQVDGSNIDMTAGPGGWSELSSNTLEQFIWVDNDGSYIGTNFISSSKQWTYDKSGSLKLPISGGQALLNPDGTPWTASSADTASNIIGGKINHIPFNITNTTLASSSLYQSGAFSIIINQDNATSANPEALYVWQPSTSINVISGKGNLDNYLQLNIQNVNQGANASSDVVATANNGNESTNYIDMGINSENYAGGFVGDANDAYLYSTGNHLHIGNVSNFPVQFFAGGSDSTTNTKLSLYPDNNHELSGSLAVSGSINVFNGITGSLFGNATSANTSSYVPTAIVTASAVNTTITFTRFNGSTFDVTVVQSGSVASASYAVNSTSASYALTASFALNAGAANFNTGSFVTTSSFNAYTSSVNRATASFATTSSLNALSSSFNSYSASLNLFSSSILSFTSSINSYTSSLNAKTSSFATTGSNSFTGSEIISGSLIVTGSVNIFGNNIISGSLNITQGITGSLFGTSSFAVSASYAVSSTSASYSLSSTSASFAISASNADLLDGSHLLQLTNTSSFNAYTSSINAVTGTFVLTSQTSSMSVLSASYAQTSSYASNFTVAGTLTAQTLVVQTVSSSVIYSSGSNRFGNDISNTQIFTGSVLVTGSLSVNGSNVILTNQTSSMSVLTASYALNATSASYAVNSTSASYARNSTSASYSLNSTSASYAVNSTTASFAISASHADFLDGYTATAFVLNSQTSSMSASYAVNSTTASYALNADLLDGINSTRFATTGSNIFVGNQTITGSFLVTGSTTQIGNNTLTGNTSLTGSVNISGSTTIFGTTNFSNTSTTITGSFLVTGSTTQIGNNNLFGNTTLSGSLIISGAVGTSTPNIQVYGDTNLNGYLRFNPVTTNINTAITASYIFVSGSTNDLYFSQNGEGYSNVTRLRWLEGNLYTGLLNGGLIATASSTVYTVQSGSGIIVSLNASIANNPYPTIKYINWGTLSASIAPLTGSYDQTFVSVDNTGNIYAQGTPYYNGQLDSLIPLGIVLHQNRSTINAIKSQPSVAYGIKQRQNTFISAFGPLKLSGHTLTPSSSLGLLAGSGTSYADGANYQTDPDNPSYVTDPGITVSKIFRYRQSGSGWVYDTNGGVGYTEIDPTQYSNNGALTSVGAGNWSIQRVFHYPNSVSKALVVYYGNAIYATEAEAIANLNIEAFSEAPNTAANALYLGAILISGNGVFTNTNTFTIYPGGLFRQVGGVGGGGSVITSTLAGLSDVTITGPTDGQSLIYDSTATKWENKSFFSGSISGNALTATTANTASYVPTAIVTASAVDTTITFTRFNGSTFNVTVSQSGSVASASYALNADLLDGLNSTQFTLTSSFNSYTASQNAINGTFTTTSSFNTLSSSFNNYTQSLNASSASIFSYTASQNALNGTFARTSSLNTLSSSFNQFTSSINAATGTYVTTSSFNSYTQSLNTFSASILNYTASQNTLNGTFATTSSLNTLSSSFNAFSASILNYTSSQNTLNGTFATTSSLNTLSSSFNSYSASLNGFSASIFSFTASQNTLNGTFATTGSNTFRGNQTITGSVLVTGSITTTGTLTAQTLVVQTVSSSVVYSSGSNIFGNNLSNTHQFTGSVQITGSLFVNGSGVVLSNQTGSFATLQYVNNLTSSFAAYTASTNAFSASMLSYTASQNALNGTFATTSSINNLTSSFTTFTSSINSFSASILNYTSSQNALNGTFTTTSSFNSLSSSFNSYTSSLNNFSASIFSFTASQNTLNGTFATTGSNRFNGNQIITGSLTVTQPITGSLNGTSSFAVSSSYALTSSYASTAQTILGTVVSASYAGTSSFASTFTITNTLTFNETLTDYATVASTIVGTNNLFTQATGSYTSGFFKYTVRNGANLRAGEVFAVYSGSSVEFSDFSTRDLGSTSDVVMSAALVGSSIQFNAITATSGWNVKAIATFM